MSYSLGQYNYVGQNVNFMTLLPASDFEVRRRPPEPAAGTQEESGTFHDECLYYGNKFKTNTFYYFHGKIKKWTTVQTFYIKLVNYNDTGDEATEQYIKTITINNSDKEEWADIEFCFAPAVEFDCLLFELVRTVEDWRNLTRYPKIIYEEISVINNLIGNTIQNTLSFIKLGVQSRPGFLMCINGEEIRTCRTGIYELKNGVLSINFFSAVAAAGENTDQIEIAEREIDALVAEAITEGSQEKLKAISSRALLGNKKAREIDNFTMDYMYKERT